MDMAMQRLNPGMMARYDIEDHRPAGVNAVQFGMSEALLGVVDRLIDDARLGIGIACVETDGAGMAEKLNAQAGLYTLIIRGYVNDEAVRREQVVHCLCAACGPEGVPGLAARSGIEFGIVDDTPEARALAARFVELRKAAGLGEIPLLRLGENLLAVSLAFLSEPDEAARQCAEMNYLDDMLHLAEPCARLTIHAPAGFRDRFPLDRAEGVRFVDADGFDAASMLKARVFDAGIFLMAAAGWLNGCDTLYDCMRHERLRKFVGKGFTEEILPTLSELDRQAVERCVIESFERYENPLNRNRILRAASGLVGRFTGGAAALMAKRAAEDFEPPRRLSFALAATIMLYAGARRSPVTGSYEVARGKRLEAIHDDERVLDAFSTLSHDMPPESLAYAALADREIWHADLRQIEGLEERVALDIAAMQREPGGIPVE